jgi:hypothetical protein
MVMKVKVKMSHRRVEEMQKMQPLLGREKLLRWGVIFNTVTVCTIANIKRRYLLSDEN